MDYTAYGGFDSIDVSDLAAPAIVVGGHVSATTVSGRLRHMFSAVPKSTSMSKLYFSGPIKVKKMTSAESVQNARRLAKVGASVSKEAAVVSAEIDLNSLDAEEENQNWYGANEELEFNVQQSEPLEERGLLDDF